MARPVFLVAPEKPEAVAESDRAYLQALGGKEVGVLDEEALSLLRKKGGVVLLDAAWVPEVERTAAGLRASCETCHVIVLTASPTWKSARAAFEAGASDYLPTFVEPQRLASQVREIAKHPPPKWPR